MADSSMYIFQGKNGSIGDCFGGRRCTCKHMPLVNVLSVYTVCVLWNFQANNGVLNRMDKVTVWITDHNSILR